jgi:hypothetical protein
VDVKLIFDTHKRYLSFQFIDYLNYLDFIMETTLSKLTEHQLLKSTLCLIEQKYGKDKAREAEIYLTQNFIMTFSTKIYSNNWVFTSEKDCKSNIKEGDFRDDRANRYRKIETSTNTNPKFPSFMQTIFTAGDKEQFETYGIKELKGTISTEKMTQIRNTFEYIFTYLKKGILVQIFNNKVEVFLPFNNANFKNIWSENLKVQPRKVIKPKGKPQFEVGYEPGEITNRKSSETLRAQLDNQKQVVERYIKEGYPLPAIQAFELFPRKEIIKDTSRWYANNCIFRNNLRTNMVDEFGDETNKDEFGGPSGEIDEGDKTIANFLEMLSVTCLHRKVDNSVFFMNYRDFPYIRLNNKRQLLHPYDALFLPSKTIPLIRLNKKPLTINQIVPIFSQSISDKENNGDNLFIDEDEIEEKLPSITKPNCKEQTKITKLTPWKHKKSEAVFRGSFTGCGTDIWNPRLQIAAISYILNQTNFTPKLDVKLTDLKKRFKKDPLKEFTDYNNPEKKIDPKLFGNYKNLIPFPTKKVKGSPLTEQQQQSYKYIIMVEGFVSPFRMSKQLSWGSLIIMVPSKWKLWFEKDNCAIPKIEFGTINKEGKLEGNINKIQALKLKMMSKNCKDNRTLIIQGNSNKTTNCPTVNIIDVENLKMTLKWCKENDNLAYQIAQQGHKYYKSYLNRDQMLNYVACKINEIK